MSTKFAARAAIDGADRLRRMEENMRLDVPRLEPQPIRPGVLAVCGYGPSLRDSWQNITTRFVCTTSGAHDFLAERGIIPTWHVEYDPREHKLDFLRNPRKETTYCIASTCSPNMFELLRDQKVLIWHALAHPDEDVALIRQVEGDNILLYGGSNAGCRAIVVGHVLGFRAFELHGFDCAYKADTIWAGPHSGEVHHAITIECNGKPFLSSQAMINSCEEVWSTMFKMLAGCQFVVHGDGLLAERLRMDRVAANGEWWRPTGKAKELIKKIAVHQVMQIDRVITDKYREQNRLMHEWNPEYGAWSAKHAPVVKQFADALGTTDILDYGCGKRQLEFGLGFAIQNYDPAIPGLDAPPRPADLVVCTDVLEHIEPQCFDAVLVDLKRVTKKQLLVTVATRFANKTLPDGRNAHLMVRDAEWWEQILAHWFTPIHTQRFEGELLGLYAAK